MIGFSQYFVQIFSDVCGDDFDFNWCFFYGCNYDGVGIIQFVRYGDEFVVENRKGWFIFSDNFFNVFSVCWMKVIDVQIY